MAKAVLCPQCGKSVPTDAPQGLCPACMMQLGPGDSQMIAPQTPAGDPDSPGPAHGMSTAEFAALTPRMPVRAGEETVAQPDAGFATEPVTSATNAAATEIPGYQVLGELGRGGMGVVYKARQIKLNRIVALKMILAGGHAGKSELIRFRTEAEAIARLQHPNIVQVHEVSEHAAVPYFSLEFCAGGSLAQKIAGTPWRAQNAARMVETLSRAMAAAHQKGVIHRDLKPANVLLLDDGTPKISDFGLAKKLDEASQTQSGAVMGTPSYMAPEQAGGKGREVGPATDVYALGAILYELLTGRPPFKAATAMDTVLQVLHDDPVPVSQLQSKTPRDLETICLKCLQKEPAKRYASADALGDDLRRFLAGEPIAARPIGVPERVHKWVRRRPVVASLLAAVCVVTLVGVGAFAWAFDQTLDARDLAIYQEKETANALVETDKARKKADEEKLNAEAARQDAESARAKTQAEKTAADIARQQAEVATQEAKKQLARAEVRGYALLMTMGQRELQSNDIQRSLETGTENHQLIGPNDALLCLAYSPDGRFLAAGSNNRTVTIWDTETRKQRFLLTGHSGPVRCLAFTPDGERLASGVANIFQEGQPQAIKLWDVATGQNLLTLIAHSRPVKALCFSHDGNRLASAGDDGTVRLWEAPP